MKNALLGFLIAIVLFGTIATTVPNQLLTIKPATPKTTVVSKAIDQDGVQDYVKIYLKQGFVIKNIFRPGGEATGWCIVVMEKY